MVERNRALVSGISYCNELRLQFYKMEWTSTKIASLACYQRATVLLPNPEMN